MAGALALLLQVAPQLTPAEQATLLTESAIDLGAPGPDSTFGAGLLDLIGAARQLHTPALDFDPPALSAAADADARLTLRADDALSSIATGEWWADADPGIGAGQPLTAADGLLDSRSEGLVASTAALAPGPHLLGMRARDAAGNWSAPTLLPISVPGLATPLAALPAVPAPAVPVAPAAPALPPALPGLELVASDGFEHGLGAWTRRIGAVDREPGRRDERPPRPAREARRRCAVLRAAPSATRRQPGRARLRPESPLVLELRRLDRDRGDLERKRSTTRFRRPALTRRRRPAPPQREHGAGRASDGALATPPAAPAADRRRPLARLDAGGPHRRRRRARPDRARAELAPTGRNRARSLA